MHIALKFPYEERVCLKRLITIIVILTIIISLAMVNCYATGNSILGELSDYGIMSSIDDFGTGYSSLSRERDLKVNCLKIDKSFVDKLLFLNPEETITGDIISMAHRLGHCVVAEGVEHEKQMQYLKAHGCEKIQGFLISKPLNEESALEFLKTNKYK